MADGIAPITLLDAVNECLGQIGESPIATLDELEAIDATTALGVVNRTSVEVQSRGWHCNSEPGFVIEPNIHGELVLPRNTLRCDSVGASAGTDVVVRGLRLYDRTNHTYEFTGPVTVDLIVGLPFEELPSGLRWYITIRSARRFLARTVGGAQDENNFTEKDEIDARAAAQEEDLSSADVNMLTGSAFTQRLTNRSI